MDKDADQIRIKYILGLSLLYLNIMANIKFKLYDLRFALYY